MMPGEESIRLGNMTSRVADEVTYTLSYDLHNRLTSINGNGSTYTSVLRRRMTV